MGVFDDSIRKLGKGQDGTRHLKPERLAGQYEIYEGYDEEGRVRVRRRAAAAARVLEGALDREALAMGALGIALGLALGITLARRGKH